LHVGRREVPALKKLPIFHQFITAVFCELKGQRHEIDTFFDGLNILIVSVYALLVFKVFQKLFNTLYNFCLFASLELLTNFENAYGNSPQNTLRCDWSIISSADLSLAAGKKCKN
jgi:hypothetical protein